MICLEKITAADFQPQTGQPFACLAPLTGFALTLVEVAILGSPRPGVTRAPFALRLTAQPGLRLPQQIYLLKNDSLGEMEIFLVQTGADPTASHFEAVFT